jgi:hypothetical protein
MYLCILDQNGAIVLHPNMAAAPEPFLRAIAPYRMDLAVAVECIFTGYWLADLWYPSGLLHLESGARRVVRAASMRAVGQGGCQRYGAAAHQGRVLGSPAAG